MLAALEGAPVLLSSHSVNNQKFAHLLWPLPFSVFNIVASGNAVLTDGVRQREDGRHYRESFPEKAEHFRSLWGLFRYLHIFFSTLGLSR